MGEGEGMKKEWECVCVNIERCGRANGSKRGLNKGKERRETWRNAGNLRQ